MIKREAEAIWRGGKAGKGELTTQSGVLEQTPYSFSTRFENGKGTNPEELVGAAHAGCFSMALAIGLETAGFQPSELRTTASVMMENQGGSWNVSQVNLKLIANVPGITDSQFQELAKKAKENCPISKLLKANISLEAKLESYEDQAFTENQL